VFPRVRAWCWWLPPCLLRSVIVNLKSDDTVALKGVLWATRGPWLTLRNVHALRVSGATAPLDGEVVVHRTNVAFLQVVA
jgi:hypothetical protein